MLPDNSRDNVTRYSPVLGVTVPESLGEWVAGDLELGYLKHETLIAACLHSDTAQQPQRLAVGV